MAKISELDRLIAPTGDEDIVVVRGARTYKTTYQPMVAPIIAPVLALRPTLGEMIDRTEITLSLASGGQSDGKALVFENGKGQASFLIFEVRIPKIIRDNLVDGMLLKIRSVCRMSPGFGGAVGAPSPDQRTRVIRASTPLGQSENLGELDAIATRFTDQSYIRETSVVWSSDMRALGGLLQFSGVVPFTGTHRIELASLTIAVQTMSTMVATSVTDLRASIDQAARDRGYLVHRTVGPSSDFASLALAGQAVKTARFDSRTRLALQPTIDPTKIDLGDYVDIVGKQAKWTRIFYPGSSTLTDDNRVAHDPIRLRGNSNLTSLSVTTKNANYPEHSESAGELRNWHQVITSCRFRHDGNEEAFAAGTLSEGGRYVPAGGWGLSSGATRTVRWSSYTSLMGGGIYLHNSGGQDDPCRAIIGPSLVGGDNPVLPDLTVSTLCSGTDDIVDIDGAIMSTGVISYTVSQSSADPLLDLADHGDFEIWSRNVQPCILDRSDNGAALRISALQTGGGFVNVDGPVASALFSLGPRTFESVAGEAGRRACAIGVANVAGAYSAGWRIAQLADRTLKVTVNGATVTYTFGDVANASNAAIVNMLNAALSQFATVDLFSPGLRHRIYHVHHERRPINNGLVGIVQGTLVAHSMAALYCRAAVAGDFGADGRPVDADLRFGVALEDIRIGRAGRVQVSGWISFRQIVADDISPGFGHGFTPVEKDGISGTLKWRGSGGSALRCIRPAINNARGRETPAILFIG